VCIQERDPIERIRKLILAHDIAPASELKVMWTSFLFVSVLIEGMCLVITNVFYVTGYGERYQETS
jgi:hypothetical protein